MGAEKNYLGVIVARGGSKRLPRKNITLLGGIPLIGYTIAATLKARRLWRTVVSTDDQEIADVAKSLGADVPFLRPSALAQDDSPAIGVLRHAVEFVETENGCVIDAVVLLQTTSPFRTGSHIDKALEIYELTNADTVTAVNPVVEHPYWSWRIVNDCLVPFFSKKHIETERSSLPAAYIENGALYIARRNLIMNGELYGDRVVPLIMDSRDATDIDTMEDLLWAEFMLSRRGVQ